MMRSSTKGARDYPASNSASNSCTCSTLATTGRIYARSAIKRSIRTVFSVSCLTCPWRTSGGETSQISTAGLGRGKVESQLYLQIPNLRICLRSNRVGGPRPIDD